MTGARRRRNFVSSCMAVDLPHSSLWRKRQSSLRPDDRLGDRFVPKVPKGGLAEPRSIMNNAVAFAHARCGPCRGVKRTQSG